MSFFRGSDPFALRNLWIGNTVACLDPESFSMMLGLSCCRLGCGCPMPERRRRSSGVSQGNPGATSLSMCTAYKIGKPGVSFPDQVKARQMKELSRCRHRNQPPDLAGPRADAGRQICFRREAPETAVGPVRRAGKRGLSRNATAVSFMLRRRGSLDQ